MSHEAAAAVTALIELGMIAQDDIVKCLKKALSEPEQQRTWVGLTDEELPPLVGDNGKYMELQQVRRFYKRIEAKLKEKNRG